MMFRPRPGILRGWEAPSVPRPDKKLKVTRKAKKAIKQVKQLALDKSNSELLNKDLEQFILLYEQERNRENTKLLEFLLGQLAIRILESYEEELLLLMELEDD